MRGPLSWLLLVLAALTVVYVKPVSGAEVILTWKLPMAPSGSLTVMLPVEPTAFDAMDMHECISTLTPLQWSQESVPSVVQLIISNTSACGSVTPSLTLHYHGHPEDPPVTILRQMDAEVVNHTATESFVALPLISLYGAYLREVALWKDRRNQELQLIWNQQSNVLINGGALVSSNSLNDRRYQAPLRSFFLCQSEELGISAWQVVNLDQFKAYTVLTAGGKLITIPANGMANIFYPRSGPFRVMETVVRWMGDARWSDGLVTMQRTIYPAIAPSSQNTCFCNYTIECLRPFAGKRLVDWRMLADDQGISASVLPLQVANQNYAIASIMALNTSITPFNLILILTVLFFTFVGIFVYVREGGVIIPDTPAARAYRATIVNEPRDVEARELEIEQAYVKGLRERIAKNKRTGMEHDDSDSSSSSGGSDSISPREEDVVSHDVESPPLVLTPIYKPLQEAQPSATGLKTGHMFDEHQW